MASRTSRQGLGGGAKFFVYAYQLQISPLCIILSVEENGPDVQRSSSMRSTEGEEASGGQVIHKLKGLCHQLIEYFFKAYTIESVLSVHALMVFKFITCLVQEKN
jgi:hypothetical protein